MSSSGFLNKAGSASQIFAHRRSCRNCARSRAREAGDSGDPCQRGVESVVEHGSRRGRLGRLVTSRTELVARQADTFLKS